LFAGTAAGTKNKMLQDIVRQPAFYQAFCFRQGGQNS